MAEFAYNNTKNAGSGHMLFELNYGYHTQISYEEEVDPRFRFKSTDKLLANLRELIIVYYKNLLQFQELQKYAYNKGIKPRSYILGKKGWLNSKYIRTKQKQKLEANSLSRSKSYILLESKHIN